MKTFDQTCDQVVGAIGAGGLCGEVMLRQWDAMESRSCYRGPNGKGFPWFQTYGEGQCPDGYWAMYDGTEHDPCVASVTLWAAGQ